MNPAFSFRVFRVFRGCIERIQIAAPPTRALPADRWTGSGSSGTKIGPFPVRFRGAVLVLTEGRMAGR